MILKKQLVRFRECDTDRHHFKAGSRKNHYLSSKIPKQKQLIIWTPSGLKNCLIMNISK